MKTIQKRHENNSEKPRKQFRKDMKIAQTKHENSSVYISWWDSWRHHLLEAYRIQGFRIQPDTNFLIVEWPNTNKYTNTNSSLMETKVLVNISSLYKCDIFALCIFGHSYFLIHFYFTFPIICYMFQISESCRLF